jgi:hypothetical protein
LARQRKTETLFGCARVTAPFPEASRTAIPIMKQGYSSRHGEAAYRASAADVAQLTTKTAAEIALASARYEIRRGWPG